LTGNVRKILLYVFAEALTVQACSMKWPKTTDFAFFVVCWSMVKPLHTTGWTSNAYAKTDTNILHTFPTHFQSSKILKP